MKTRKIIPIILTLAVVLIFGCSFESESTDSEVSNTQVEDTLKNWTPELINILRQRCLTGFDERICSCVIDKITSNVSPELLDSRNPDDIKKLKDYATSCVNEFGNWSEKTIIRGDTTIKIINGDTTYIVR